MVNMVVGCKLVGLPILCTYMQTYQAFFDYILSSPFTTPSLICSLQSCLRMYQETSSVPALFPAHIVFRFLSISCMSLSKSTWFKRTKKKLHLLGPVVSKLFVLIFFTQKSSSCFSIPKISSPFSSPFPSKKNNMNINKHEQLTKITIQKCQHVP